jgi:hypothetical protein
LIPARWTRRSMVRWGKPSFSAISESVKPSMFSFRNLQKKLENSGFIQTFYLTKCLNGTTIKT